MATAPARRVRFVLSGVIALALLAGGTLYVARGVFFRRGLRAGGRDLAGHGGRMRSGGHWGLRRERRGRHCRHRRVARDGDGPAAVRPAARLRPGPSAPASTAPALALAALGRGPATGTASAQPSASAPSASASPPAAQGGTAAAQVLALINQARSAAGLPALTITSGLQASSSAHNLRMAGGCGLSHQCPGEPAIGDRETAAGVHWTAAGENIGEGGPVADTSAAIAQMAVGLTQSMLNEKPPERRSPAEHPEQHVHPHRDRGLP